MDKVVIGARAVSVRELTVKEQRKWLQMRDKLGESIKEDFNKFDMIGWHQFKDVTVEDIVFITDLKKSELEDFKPSEIQTVVDEIKRLNPHFFAMRERAGLVPTEN